MTSSSGELPHWEIEFDEHGQLKPGGDIADVVHDAGVRDLFLFTHGWNTSSTSARELSDAMRTLLTDVLPAQHQASTGFITVIWPALLFPDDAPADSGHEITQPQTAALGPFAAHEAPAGPDGSTLVAALSPAFPDKQHELQQIGQLLDNEPQDMQRLTEFHKLASGLVTTVGTAPEDAGEAAAMGLPTSRVMDEMAVLAQVTGQETPFTRLWAGARQLLRVLSYYEMKERAGVVGRVGLGPFVAALAARSPGIRVHLMGHSFGARAVAFCLQGLPDGSQAAASPVKSLYLIQGAFSHFCFASSAPVTAGRGALAGYANRVDGPSLATFSAADRALSWWYPNASRLAWQDSEGVDDINYQWAAMGFDGFQQAEALNAHMTGQGTSYGFANNTFYRIDAGDVIKQNLNPFAGAHSDIQHEDVAWVAVSAAGLG